MSCILRKPVLEVSDQALTQTGLYSHRRWLEAGYFGFRNKRDSLYVAKLGADKLPMQLICAFDFAYSKSS